MEQLESKHGEGKAKKTSEKSQSENNVTYELMMKPESAKLEEGEALAKLESRISAMEKVLGASPEGMVGKIDLIRFFSAFNSYLIKGVIIRGNDPKEYNGRYFRFECPDVFVGSGSFRPR